MDQGPDRDHVSGFEDIVAGVLEVDPADVTDAAGPDMLTTWTSLRHLQLVVTLEEAYGISFSYQEIRGLRYIGDVRRALHAKRAADQAFARGEDPEPLPLSGAAPAALMGEPDGHPVHG